MRFSLVFQVIVPFVVGGTVRTIRYVVQTNNQSKQNKNIKLTLKDAAISFAEGAITGIIGVNLFNPDGEPEQILTISAFTGIGGIAWIMSRSELSPEQEESLLNNKKKAIDKLGTFENMPVETPQELMDVTKQNIGNEE